MQDAVCDSVCTFSDTIRDVYLNIICNCNLRCYHCCAGFDYQSDNPFCNYGHKSTEELLKIISKLIIKMCHSWENSLVINQFEGQDGFEVSRCCILKSKKISKEQFFGSSLNDVGKFAKPESFIQDDLSICAHDCNFLEDINKISLNIIYNCNLRCYHCCAGFDKNDPRLCFGLNKSKEKIITLSKISEKTKIKYSFDLSIDGVTKESFESIRHGAKFEQIIETAYLLKNYFDTQTNFTIKKPNIGDIDKVADFFKDFRLFWSYDYYDPECAKYLKNKWGD